MTLAHLTVLRGPLEAPIAADVRALAGAAASADGVAPLGEQPLLGLTAPEPTTAHLLARAAGGELAGYAQVALTAPEAASAELAVAPQWRRRGVGRQLLDGALAAAPGPLSVWAHGDLPAARALAAGAGLAVVRELWFMTADLPAAPPAPDPVGPPSPPDPARAVALPPGVVVRAFVPGRDEDAWLRVNARAFANHPEQGRLTRRDLDARQCEPWFDPAGLLLAERDGALLGSIWLKVHPGDGADAAAGEIYALGVDPDAQGLGLGGALTRLGLDQLIGRGLRRAILYTEGDNTVAIAAYTRAGFTRAGLDVQFA
ncbi:mycothiol synthase [Pengzhenrongella sicca]|uniref:Mycothiol acetyltransferase n=1 Tax=Pengzhenrongella sicca TaxID=2819238 RepID=A0A8A4ZCP1_9MICO|nr:mycothiol synthase [Pengzhenrongella sicca]QTE29702.1 mycothiol synthase [Pengzhenrongella sicca]